MKTKVYLYPVQGNLREITKMLFDVMFGASTENYAKINYENALYCDIITNSSECLPSLENAVSVQFFAISGDEEIRTIYVAEEVSFAKIRKTYYASEVVVNDTKYKIENY